MTAIARLLELSFESPSVSTAPVLIPVHRLRESSSTYRESMPGGRDNPVSTMRFSRQTGGRFS